MKLNLDSVLKNISLHNESGNEKLEQIPNIIDERDSIYQYNKYEQDAILNTKPWKKDPNYFKDVKISTKALVNMMTHAKQGGEIEVMGIMLGKVIDTTIVVLDAFALPVEGTETRVNAQSEGNEYMIEYLTSIRETGRLENAIGWYHSHPGYGCWLSGIDVSTQTLNQQFQDPFLAVVVDPLRSSSSGKVEIGAFRTYPQGYKPTEKRQEQFQAIPFDKIEDFGVHSEQYYPLSISYFKSSEEDKIINSLWNKYWMNTLSTSQLFSNQNFFDKQIQDISIKLKNKSKDLNFLRPSNRDMGLIDKYAHIKPDDNEDGDEKSHISRIAKENDKININMINALFNETVKYALFDNLES